MPRFCCQPDIVNIAIDYFNQKRVVYIREDMISALEIVISAISNTTKPEILQVENNIPYYFWDADNIDSHGYYTGELKYNRFNFTREVPKWDKIDASLYISEKKDIVESDITNVKGLLQLAERCNKREATPYHILIEERDKVLKDILTEPCINPTISGYSENECTYDKVDNTDITVLYIYNPKYAIARLVVANDAVIYILNALGEFEILNHFKIKEIGELGIIQRLADILKTQILLNKSIAESYYDMYIDRKTSSAIDTNMIREYIRDNYLVEEGEGRYYEIKFAEFTKKIKKIFNISDTIDISFITDIVYKSDTGLVYKKGLVSDKLNAEKEIMTHIQSNSSEDYKYMTEYMDDMMGYINESDSELYKCSKLKMHNNLIFNKKMELNIHPIGISSRDDKYGYSIPINNNDISCVLPKSDLDAVFQPVYEV